MKRKLALLLAITLLASGIHWNNDAMAATKKVALSKKSVQLSEGKTMSMTLKNARKRVKWAIENKKIVQITKKSGARKNKIVIKGKKAGTTKITAKCGKKKYVVKVKVRAKKDIVQTTANNPKEATTAISETTTAEAVTTVIEETAKTAEETTNAVEDKTEVIGETTKDIETTIPEGTTEAIVEATTLSETTNGIMETTTIEEKTGAAVEMTTIAGETTTIIEETSNNSEQWSTEQETTKAPISDTEESVRIIGEVKNDKMTVDDDLYISYRIDGNEGAYAYYNEIGKLEIFEDDTWKQMEREDGVVIGGMGYMLFAGESSEYRVELQNWYKDIRPGHYRYTHKIGDMDVPVEFDICGENHLETP